MFFIAVLFLLCAAGTGLGTYLVRERSQERQDQAAAMRAKEADAQAEAAAEEQKKIEDSQREQDAIKARIAGYVEDANQAAVENCIQQVRDTVIKQYTGKYTISEQQMIANLVVQYSDECRKKTFYDKDIWLAPYQRKAYSDSLQAGKRADQAMDAALQAPNPCRLFDFECNKQFDLY